MLAAAGGEEAMALIADLLHQANDATLGHAQGASPATYDVRWHVDQIGADAGTPSNSFLLTVASKRKGLALPLNVRVVVGRPE